MINALRRSATWSTFRILQAPVLALFVLPGIAFAGGSLSIELTEIIDSGDGLDNITDITHAGDSRLFVVEQRGRIWIYDGGSVLGTPFLDIRSRVDDSDNEEGLLGLVFHPDHATNGYFYVNYTNTTGTRRSRISRFSVTVNPNVADDGSEDILLTIDQPVWNHNAGDLAFGPDGFLYIPMGDGGGGGDTDDNAQNLSLLLGKIARIDVDSGPGTSPDCDGVGTGNYTIPNTNPMTDGAGGTCDEIWAVGVRNPWRIAFDSATDDLWIADVGQGSWEEIDVQPASSTGGENYGWRCYEGNATFNTSGCGPSGNYEFPVHEYSHGGSPFRCSVTGGFVYRGSNSALSGLVGQYLFSDYCSDQIWALHAGTYALSEFDTITTVPGTASFADPTTYGEDAAGELYVANGGSNGSVFRITGVTGPIPVELQTFSVE